MLYILYKLTDITYEFLEPQELSSETECVITAHLDTNANTTATLSYKLAGIELNPNYLTTDRLYELLRRHFLSNNVIEYEVVLENFVMEFITLIRGWATNGGYQ